MREGDLFIFWVSTSPVQASSVDMFGSVAYSGPVLPPAEPAVTIHSLQNLQDLAMMGFSDHKRYKVNYSIFSSSLFNRKSVLSNDGFVWRYFERS